MNDNLDEYLAPNEPIVEKRKRGRPAGKKVAASRITGGQGKASRSVEVLVRFPEADFRRIAAAARSKTTTDPDIVRQLVRRGWDLEEISMDLRDLCRRLKILEEDLGALRWRSMSGHLIWFQECLTDMRMGNSPLVDAIAKRVIEAMLEHDTKVRMGKP